MGSYLKISTKILVTLLMLITSSTLLSQNCTTAGLDKGTVQFSLSGGSDNVNVIFPFGCTNPTVEAVGAPSWLTVSVVGTTINLSCSSTGSYREAQMVVQVNGNFVNGFTVKQGTLPCSITGMPSSETMASTGETKSYTLIYTNCSVTLPYTFRDALNPQDPLPSWINITQSGNTITVTTTINDTNNTRVLYLEGIPVSGLNIGMGITQNTCYLNWYPDGDNDTYGNAFATPISSCTDPSDQFMTYVQNNDDTCPEVSGPNQGCLSGEVLEDINWVASKAYDINGNLKASSKAYFDDLGKGIQSQSLDVKTGRTWATQTMYDTQGRPALNTLSAPVRDSGGFEYASGFVQDENDSPYNANDFETNPEDPTPIGQGANTLGYYYSEYNETDTSNPNDTRPKGDSYQDVTEYPFSRTIYSELTPGAALRAIGGNKVDADNNSGTPDAWIQSYTFSMLAGDELTREGAFNDPSYKVTSDRKIVKTISKDVHGDEVVVFTDTDGKTLAAARAGGAEVRDTYITIGEQGFVDVHVPGGTTGFINNGQFGIHTEVYDLITEEVVTADVNTLPSGFYRVSVTNMDVYSGTSTPIVIRCKENYYDYSLNEYDEAGRLTASYQPVGNTKSQKPVTTYSYNALGQLLSTTSPDEGTANFKYRKDGQIRFSQNSKQLENTEFSYTNYDALGRPIESGVFNEGSITFANADSIVDNVDNPATSNDEDGLPDASCSEQHFTTYDALSSADLAILNGVHSSYGKPSFLAGNVAKTENDHTTTYYSYDVYGRVKWMVQDIPGLGTKTIDYKYDQITGAVTEVDYQKNVSGERFVHRYTYNPVDDSLIKVETSTNGSSFTTHANYKYNETGALKRLEIAPLNNTGTPLQGIDYVYNLNGQLKSINHPSLTQSSDPGGDSNDLFGMQIDYHNKDYSRSDRSNINTQSYGKDRFNGNIKGIRWNNKEIENAQKTYSYYYNRNNWLSNAVYGQYADTSGDGSKINIVDAAIYDSGTKDFKATNSITFVPGFHAKSGTTITAEIVSGTATAFQLGDYNVFDITYDANGNIRTLNRNKDTSSGDNKMDQLSYAYNPEKPNQLLRVDDAAGEVLAGKDIGDQDGNNYEYNSIGQLVKNNEEGIEYIYNASGLVTEIKKNNLTLVKFFYNDKGHRVKKEVYSGSSLTRTDYYIRDAAGTALAIYEGSTVKEHTIYGASRLGVYNRTDGSSYYQLTDHLGNVRAVTGRASNGTPVAIVANTDYYPFGMPMPNRNLEGGYRYGYQGEFAEKEGEMTGVSSFELRLWDSRIGRWLSPDPMGQHASPYLGMGNNPITRVDPDGGSDCPDPPCNQYGGDNGRSMTEGITLDTVCIGCGAGSGSWGADAISYGSFENSYAGSPASYIKNWPEFANMNYNQMISHFEQNYGDYNKVLQAELAMDEYIRRQELLAQHLMNFGQAFINMSEVIGVGGFKPTKIRARGPIGSLASLPRRQRLKLFKEGIANAPTPKNPNHAIKIINRVLNRVEKIHSTPGNRMYGILDEKYVARLSNGNVTAFTKGHRIEILKNGSFSIFEKKSGKLFLTK